MYGEDQWFLIEDANYEALLSICLEKKKEQDNQLAAEEQQVKVICGFIVRNYLLVATLTWCMIILYTTGGWCDIDH